MINEKIEKILKEESQKDCTNRSDAALKIITSVLEVKSMTDLICEEKPNSICGVIGMLNIIEKEKRIFNSLMDKVINILTEELKG